MSWIEKHSVGCFICGELFDERDGVLMAIEGTACPKCIEKAASGEGDYRICDECEKVFKIETAIDIVCPNCL